MRRALSVLIGVGCASLLAGCGDATAPAVTGRWTADGIALTLTADSVRLELPCGSGGTIPRSEAVDSAGVLRFSVVFVFPLGPASSETSFAGQFFGSTILAHVARGANGTVFSDTTYIMRPGGDAGLAERVCPLTGPHAGGEQPSNQ